MTCDSRGTAVLGGGLLLCNLHAVLVVLAVQRVLGLLCNGRSDGHAFLPRVFDDAGLVVCTHKICGGGGRVGGGVSGDRKDGGTSRRRVSSRAGRVVDPTHTTCTTGGPSWSGHQAAAGCSSVRTLLRAVYAEHCIRWGY